MDTKLALTIFITVFLAELGDKTQLATMLFASKPGSSLTTVFAAASAALIASTALGVLAGAALSSVVTPKALNYTAGIGFMLIGAWTLWRA